MQNTAIASDARIITNIPADLKKNWETAAEIKGLTLTDFVIKAANDAMEKALSDQYMITPSVRDQIQIAETLITPPQPLNEAMQNVLRKRYEHLDNAAKDNLRECFEHARNA
jgi:uncharacterized protein (DUF1778 family)